MKHTLTAIAATCLALSAVYAQDSNTSTSGKGGSTTQHPGSSGNTSSTGRTDTRTGGMSGSGSASGASGTAQGDTPQGMGRPDATPPSGHMNSGMRGDMNTDMHGNMSSDTVRQVQQQLASRGFDPGPVDGVMGPRTREALKDFHRSKGMAAGAGLDATTLGALGVSQGGATGTTDKGTGR